MNASVQREIIPGTSVTFSFVRRDYHNLIWSDNTLIDPSDYTKCTITSPTGSKGGRHSPEPGQGSAFSLLDQNSSQNRRYYNGYDISFQEPYGRG